MKEKDKKQKINANKPFESDLLILVSKIHNIATSKSLVSLKLTRSLSLRQTPSAAIFET